MDKIITRAEAKAAGLTRYFTGEPCKHGHFSARVVRTTACVDCKRRRRSEWKANNPDSVLATNSAWQEANRERQRAYEAARYAANPELRRAAAKARYAANSERDRATTAAWKAANPDRRNATESNRRARKVAAIPADWSEFDQFVIEEAAAACKRREAMTGYAWHIDHMIPLAKGGLHAWNNIQAIPARMNLWKNDKLILTERMEWVGGLPGA